VNSPVATLARGIPGIAAAAGGGFAAFYCFYAAAPTVFGGDSLSAGIRVAVVMIVVVAVQPLLLVAGPWVRNRHRAVLIALSLMSMGLASLHLGAHWLGSIILGLGFGAFVVVSTAWVKEQAAPSQVGHALGVYGFGSAVGGAIGAPVGLFVAQQANPLGVLLSASAFAACALIPAWASGARHTVNPVATLPSPAVPTCAANQTARSHSKETGVLAVTVAGHLLAVSAYAAVLSSIGSLALSSAAWVTVLVAFLIQVALALGRLAGGFGSDRWPPVGVMAAALVLLLWGATGFLLASTATTLITASILVAFTSGTCQTAALTLMMRRTRGPNATERVSVIWNIGFDVGLGAGAIAASLKVDG
jgi:predicted MFS family arabinose efflux permease